MFHHIPLLRYWLCGLSKLVISISTPIPFAGPRTIEAWRI